jgi:hypothetical protein
MYFLIRTYILFDDNFHEEFNEDGIVEKCPECITQISDIKSLYLNKHKTLLDLLENDLRRITSDLDACNGYNKLKRGIKNQINDYDYVMNILSTYKVVGLGDCLFSINDVQSIEYKLTLVEITDSLTVSDFNNILLEI